MARRTPPHSAPTERRPKILTLLVMLPGLALNAALPGFARLERDPRAVGVLASRVWHWLATFGLPLCTAAFVFAEPVVRIAFGDGYETAVPLVRILALAGAVTLFANVLGTVLVAQGAVRPLLIQNGIALVVNVGGNFALVPRFGVTASAWLTVATERLVAAGSVYLVRARLGSIFEVARSRRPSGRERTFAGGRLRAPVSTAARAPGSRGRSTSDDHCCTPGHADWVECAHTRRAPDAGATPHHDVESRRSAPPHRSTRPRLGRDRLRRRADAGTCGCRPHPSARHVRPACLRAGSSRSCVRGRGGVDRASPAYQRVHSSLLRGPRRRGAGAAKRAFKRSEALLASRIVTVCEHSKGFLGERYGINGRRVRAILNGVTLPPASAAPTPNGRLRVLAIGTLNVQKGHDVLLAAAGQAHGDWNVTIIGEGSARASLEQIADRLGSGRVSLAGWREDAVDAPLLADVLCLPSRWEACPYVVLDAMARARCVVASNVDGLPEMIEHGISGLLVEPDDPSALAAALDHLSAHPETVRRMGLAARERAEDHFRVERMVAATHDLYREVLGA